MTIPTALLAILRCPLTRASLVLAGEDVLATANARIGGKNLFHADGSRVRESLTAGLLTVDGRILYRVSEGIPILLASAAIFLSTDAAVKQKQTPTLRAEKACVQQFYDELGWTENAAGDFIDAEKWEDLRPVAAEYIHACHQRVGEYFTAGGDFFLDVASGPVQYPEYLAYSTRYTHRICVDLSYRALRAAKEKLSSADLCVLADITALPFVADTFAGVVSLHTIYHVAADEQAAAFNELHRVQASGGAAVVVYSWGRRTRLMQLAFLPRDLLLLPYRKLRDLARWGKRLIQKRVEKDDPSDGQDLYFRPHDYHWFKSQGWDFEYEILCWRSVNVKFLRTYIHSWLAGRHFLRWLRRRENAAPEFYGRYGQYPLIRLHKK